MKIHFSQGMKLHHSKKKVISDLVCQRINLLIGARKSAYIENVFFCDTLPKEVLSLQNSAINHHFSPYIGLCLTCGKANLYCTTDMLNSLIYQSVEMPNFDDEMIAISKVLPIHFSP